jgi:nicotinic acid mononucleotide adenylyltransferase
MVEPLSQLHDTVRRDAGAMSPPARWQARYTAASALLRSAADVLAIRTCLMPEHWASGQPLQWVGDPPAVGADARVGVLAGSFNPLTLAHTALMGNAARALRLTTVVWACSRITIDKERVERATLVDRLVQLQAYLRASRRASGLLVLEAGLYADQAAALRAALPLGARLWLVVGYDKLAQIFDARYYADRDVALRKLFESADLAVAPRGERHRADLADLLALPTNRPFARHVRLLPARPALARLSSTAARALAAGGATGFELLSHVEPEGAALARATGAYGPPLTDPAGAAIDPYAVRQALITRLVARPKATRPEVFGRLLDRACAPTPDGACLRETLLRETLLRETLLRETLLRETLLRETLLRETDWR